MGCVILDWFSVTSVEELKVLGKFNEVRARIKDDGGKHIHISGRSWIDLLKSIEGFKQTLEKLNVISCQTVEVNIVNESSLVQSDREYFTNLANEYIFYLTQLDGELRMNKLGITSIHFSDKRKAKSWRDKISKTIHPDVCHHVHASEAMSQLNDLYNQMIGRE